MSDGQNNTAGVVDGLEGAALLDENGNVVSVVTQVPANIAGDGPSDEVIETVADTTVAVATIEADRDVTIAAIHADTEAARIAADVERDRELNEMRERNQWLEANLASTMERAAEAERQISALTPLPSPEPEGTTVVAVVDPQTIDTLETTPETSSSTQTEAQSESGVESPAETAAQVVAAILPGVTRVKRRTRFL